MMLQRCVGISQQHAACMGLTPCIGIQGANVADSAFIDSTDVMDLDFLTIGPDAVVSEGTIVTCHTFKDGFITYSKVRPN